jgi:PIN domain nuclease of toxin-antitoxin system
MHLYLLDTNIVLYAVDNGKELDGYVRDILDNYGCNNRFFVSTVYVREIIHLYKRGKIKTGWKRAEDILPAIEAMGFELLPVKKEHLAAYASLSTPAAHNDPNDHIIIAQAIAERVTLVSSDRQFEGYTRQRLSFIFNSRG